MKANASLTLNMMVGLLFSTAASATLPPQSVNAPMAELGSVLIFDQFDVSLGDDSLSCASCHIPETVIHIQMR